MRQLNGVYTQAYNRRHNKTGHLFQGRYKSILVDEESYLLELSRYIVLNPVKAGMVERVNQWKWSSYQATVGEAAAPEWLAIDYLLSQFSVQRKTAIRKYRMGSGLVIRLRFWCRRFMSRPLRLEFPDALYHLISQGDRREYIYEDDKVKAYASGAYTYQVLGDYFDLHFTHIGKIVRMNRKIIKTKS